MNIHAYAITRNLHWLFLLLVICLLLPNTTQAAGTPAGTVITNFATATYKDKNGNNLPAIKSNTVTTIVAQVAGIDISPATGSENVLQGNSAVFSLRISNIGNGPDNAKMSISGIPTNWSATLYKDLDGDNVLDAEERIAANILSLVLLKADETVSALLQVTAPTNAADGDKAPVTVAATSQFNTNVSDAGTYTATVTAATVSIVKTVTPTNPKPGEVVTYAIQLENTGSNTAFNVVISDPLPAGVVYVPASIRSGQTADLTYDTAQSLTDDADSDVVDFGITASNTLTIKWGNAPSGQAGVVFLRAKVNDGLASGTVVANIATIAYESPINIPAPTINSPPGTFTTGIKANPIAPLALSNSGEPGDSLAYKIPITNGGNSTDVFNLSPATTRGFVNKIWVDVNNDGIPGNNGDFLLIDTDSDGNPDTGNLNVGEKINLIVEVFIAPGTADGVVDVTTLTLFSSNDPTVSATTTLTTTVKAPFIRIVKSVTPDGAQPPKRELTYKVVVTNVGTGIAKNVIITDKVPIHTTYVANSIEIDKNARTDATDADNVQVENREILINLGTLGPTSTHTITFRVVID